MTIMVVLKHLLRLVGALPIVLGSAAIAQTTTAAQNSSEERIPPPECSVPIGVTVGGDLVFPFLCKDFLRGARGDQGFTSAEMNSAQAADKEPNAQPSETAFKLGESIPLPQPRPRRLRKLISFAGVDAVGHSP
jgi:hypothetical protein